MLGVFWGFEWDDGKGSMIYTYEVASDVLNTFSIKKTPSKHYFLISETSIYHDRYRPKGFSGCVELYQYFRQKKLKDYAAFLSSSSFCWGVI